MHLNFFLSGREKKLAASYLCQYSDNCSPWEDIIRKKVSKLRSIAELRAFDGMIQNITKSVTH
jgi:hypothetical protein